MDKKKIMVSKTFQTFGRDCTLYNVHVYQVIYSVLRNAPAQLQRSSKQQLERSRDIFNTILILKNMRATLSFQWTSCAFFGSSGVKVCLYRLTNDRTNFTRHAQAGRAALS